MSYPITSKKKIRSQPPDVIVAVGRGECMQEFHCYRVILSFASDYFDSMLSARMLENETGRIELPTKDPKMWKKFYSFINPDRLSVAETHTLIDVSNAITFVPWFHEFQMTNYLAKCDHVLARRVEEIRADENEFLYTMKFNEFGNSDNDFQEIVELLKLSCTYDLERTKDKAEEFICSLLEKIQRTSDLFDLNRIKSLYSLFAPVQKDESSVEHEDGLVEIIKEIIPAGKSTRICYAFLNMTVSIDNAEPVLIYHLVNDLSLETINNPEVFPLLLHSYVLRATSVAAALNYKGKLAEKDSLIAEKDSIIRDMMTKIARAPGNISLPRATVWNSPSAAEYWEAHMRNQRSA